MNRLSAIESLWLKRANHFTSRQLEKVLECIPEVFEVVTSMPCPEVCKKKKKTDS